MVLDESPLGGPVRLHGAHHVGRVCADAAGQVVEEALCRGEVRGVGDLGDDPEKVQAGAAGAHLVERAHARGFARQELLHLASQVPIEAGRANGGRDRGEQRQGPQEAAVA